MKDIVTQFLDGSVDFHIHVSPDPFVERIADANEVALQAKHLGMKGVVLKSHTYPTAPLAHMARKAVERIEILGSLTLNHAIGGINPHAVEVSAKMGARVVWMPTLSSIMEMKNKGFSNGIFILGENGEILPEVREVLALIKQFDLVLSTGHLSKEEITSLLKEAFDMGITKFVITHPLKVAGTSLELETQKEWSERGAFIEHCFVATMPLHGRLNPLQIVQAVRFVGAERCLLSTDFGQRTNPPPWEGMRMMLATLMQCGLSEKELHLLVKENPCRLLNL
jgi:hypothetical protein